jgi:hypothetical protein
MPLRKTKDFLTFFLALFVCFGAFTGHALAQAQTPDQTAGAPQDQITAVPNRPTFSTTAETIQRGVLEVEFGFEGGAGHQDLNGLLKFGLTKNLEIRFANNPFLHDRGTSTCGDSGAGFKYRFVSQGKLRPTISVLYMAIFPTAGSNLGSGAVGHSLLVLLSKDFGKHHFDVNEGVQFAGRPGASGFDRNYFSAVDYARPIKGKWGLAAEIAGTTRTNATTPANMTLLGAATYNVSSRFVLDGGVYFAPYGNLPVATGFAGLTYSIADLYHHRSQARASGAGN